MNPSSFLLILLGVALNAAAQILLKLGSRDLDLIVKSFDSMPRSILAIVAQPYIIFGLAIYTFSAGIWIMVLSKVDVTLAYPMLSIGYIFGAFIAWYWMGEAMNTYRLVGISTIILGVAILARG